MKVLVADPSRSYRSFIEAMLSQENIGAITVDNSESALEFLRGECPDLICVAREIGSMNSFEFIETLKANELCIDIPKFLLSSNVSADFRRQCYDIGYTEILNKTDSNTLQIFFKSLAIKANSEIEASVLYVEDVASTAAYTIALMQDMGWKVEHVTNGEEAIKKIEANDYDLLITDLVLEGKLSGINVIDHLRSSGSKNRDLPILALSGWNDVLRQVYVLQRGSSDFISKPFQENDFKARALNLIQNKRRIDESEQMQKQLQHQANFDKLTQLRNRRSIEHESSRLIEEARLSSSPLSLLVIDLDHFKTINDTFGHETGDEVLRQVAGQLKRYSRDSDIVGRWGGEEFLVLLPNCSHSTALTRAELIRLSIETEDFIERRVTTSIGVSTLLPEPKDNFMNLFNSADEALYRAKDLGRNRVESARERKGT